MEHTLNTKEAAAYVGVAVHTLLAYRKNRLHLPYLKDTTGHISYRKSDLDAFLAKRPAATLVMPVTG